MAVRSGVYAKELEVERLFYTDIIQHASNVIPRERR